VVTAAGHTFSKGTNGIVVDGTSTFAASGTIVPGGSASVVTVDGHTFSANSDGDVIVDGTSTVQIAVQGSGVLGEGAATGNAGGPNTLTTSLAAGQGSASAVQSTGSDSRSSGNAPAQQTTNAASRAEVGAFAGLVLIFIGVLALL